MEFRTEVPGPSEDEKKGGPSSTVDSLLNKYIEGVKDDPQMKLQLLQTLKQNGVDPSLVAPLVDLDSEEIQQLAQQQAAQQQTQQVENTEPEPTPNMTEDTTEKVEVNKKPSPEKVMGFLDEIIELNDEDMTLGELREWCEENTNMVETAINLKW